MTVDTENSSPSGKPSKRPRTVTVGQTILEGVAVMVMVVLLAGGGIIWRLIDGPLDVSFARDYIEQALRDPSASYSADLDAVKIAWPDVRGPVMLDLSNTRLLRLGQPVMNIGNMRIALSRTSLLAGKVAPVGVTLKAPALRLVRMDDNHVGLSFESDAAPDVPESNSGSPLMEALAALAASDDAGAPGPLHSLRHVEITGARAIIEDHVLGETWYMNDLNLEFEHNAQGLGVKATISLPGGRTGPSRLALNAIYYRNSGNIRVNAHVTDLDPRVVLNKIGNYESLTAQKVYLNGDVSFLVNADMQVENADLAVSSYDGELSLGGIYDAPVPFQSATLHAKYDRAAATVTIEPIALRVQDVEMAVTGVVALGTDTITAPLTLTVPEISQEKIAALWPTILNGKSAEDWLIRRLTEGTVHNVSASLLLTGTRRPEGGWTAAASAGKADFDMTDMKVNYRAPLTPATNVSGKGHFENDALTFTIDSATLGDLTVSKGTVKIDKIASNDIGTADVAVDLGGPLLSLFRYIADEPIGIGDKELGLKTADVKGRADLAVNISFPTVKDLKAADVKVSATGTVSDVYLPGVVRDMALTGGPLKLAVDGGKVTLSGKGKLDGRDIDLAWQQYRKSAGNPFSSQVTASLNADKSLRDKLGITLDDWIDGAAPVKVTYTQFGEGRSEADITADLGPARLMVKPMQYEKLPGAAGTAKCLALLTNGALTEVKNLDVTAPGLALTGGNLLFDKIKDETIMRHAALPKVILGETDAAVNIDKAADGHLQIGVHGDFLDASSFLDRKKESKEPYAGPRVIASVDVGRLRTRDARLVEKAKIYLDLNAQGLLNQLEVDATAGKGPIYLRLKPDPSGKLTFNFQADDAGAALRAFDVYENVEGGKLVMTGQSASVQNARAIIGKAQLNDFRVVRAPVLARLVGAISPVGLPQLLGGEGLYFARLESDFEWRMRQPGDIYVIKDGRTSGSSLGLTFAGSVDREKDYTDLKGQIVPVSEVNDLIGNIPLIGDILTGGDALFAATYSIRGPSETPTVSVNPLAVLTPGILRRIFFEGGD